MLIHRFLQLLLMIYPFVIEAQDMPVSLTVIRQDFVYTGTHRCTSDTLYQKLQAFDLEKFPVLLAYRGVSRAMMADCVTNPYKKFEYFKSGKNEIEKAMRLSPNSLDVHFVRYMAQARIPAFLGYNNKNEDIEFIFSKLDEYIQSNYDLYFCRTVIKALRELHELEKSNKIRLETLSEKLLNKKNNNSIK